MEWSAPEGPTPVLALDTSTQVASVAVVGRTGVTEVEGRAAARSDDLIGLVDRALAGAGAGLADLGGIAVGAGPGSFTGLRIGMATAKGLCFASGLPLWSVSSLAALALDAADVEPDLSTALVVTVIDIRRGEICAGFYRVASPRVESVADERVLEPAQLADAVAALCGEHGLTRALLVGDAIELHGAALADAGQPLVGARVTPSARSVALLALAGPRHDVLRSGTPVYIRPSAAEVAFPDGNPGSRQVGVPPGKK